MDPSTTGAPKAPHPTRSNIDVFGCTHIGRVRAENQDHFLIGSLHKTMEIYQTTLRDEQLPSRTSGSRGMVFLVADGVGGGTGGAEASGTALREIAGYITHVMDLYVEIDPEREAPLLAQLQRSVERSHETVRATSQAEHGGRGMATTLTMVTVIWPRAYLVHVGDSRCYLLRDGVLEQLTKDQTMAQAMIDAGALTTDQAEKSHLKHVLWSAVGGSEAVPEVRTIDCAWDDVMLLCTDGLTKHVDDTEIRDVLLAGAPAEQSARRLVDLVLERGGSDNVTVIVGRLSTAE